MANMRIHHSFHRLEPLGWFEMITTLVITLMCCFRVDRSQDWTRPAICWTRCRSRLVCLNAGYGASNWLTGYKNFKIYKYFVLMDVSRVSVILFWFGETCTSRTLDFSGCSWVEWLEGCSCCRMTSDNLQCDNISISLGIFPCN